MNSCNYSLFFNARSVRKLSIIFRSRPCHKRNVVFCSGFRRVACIGLGCSISSSIYMYSSFNVSCTTSRATATPVAHIEDPFIDYSLSSAIIFQKIFITLRLFYLLVIFAPSLMLHVVELFLPFRVIHYLKWYCILKTIQHCGPAFIKLGQWASTRRDVFPSEFCDKLSQLQRNCSYHSWKYTHSLLCDSLGPNWEDNFFQIDHMPIGSGCIGQVYKWVLKNDAVNDKSLLSDGESDHLTVAVKVLHPNVTELVLRDVLLMSWIASWIDYMCPDVYWVSLRECVHEFGEVMKKQLDLRLEAHNMKILKECFATHDYVRIPTPIDSLVDKSILVETFEEGINISEYLKKPPTQFHKQIASLGIDTILHMLFVHNIVHCDMHPGNLLIHKGTDGLPVLVLLDCGVTTSLSHRDWNNFHELFIAIVKAEGNEVADLMLRNSRFNNCQDIASYRKDMSNLITTATQQLNLKNVEVGQLLSDLFMILVNHKVKLEANFASVIIAIMVLEGIGRSLDPELDILSAAKPFLFKKTVKSLFKNQ